MGAVPQTRPEGRAMPTHYTLTPVTGDWSSYEDTEGESWTRSVAWAGEECSICGRALKPGQELFENLDSGDIVCSRHITINEE